MTTTLLKHEWLRTRGTLGMLFGILALVVILGALLAATGWPLLSELGVLLAMLGLFVLVPAAQLLLTADYWRSGYGRTGYFTHSIPARGATIFRAKLAWAIIASFAALVLTVVLGLAFEHGGEDRDAHDAGDKVHGECLDPHRQRQEQGAQA